MMNEQLAAFKNGLWVNGRPVFDVDAFVVVFFLGRGWREEWVVTGQVGKTGYTSLSSRLEEEQRCATVPINGASAC
jgi:hypothetical protein